MNTLIKINDFPAVVVAENVKQLRLSKNAPACARFMQSYLGFDEHARFTLQILIDSLSNDGGAYFVNGVFGSGKSHLLGILTLLGDGLGHSDFLQVHPQFAAQLSTFPRRFTVYFSLDEYDGSRLSLEEITWREIALRAQQLGVEIHPFDPTTTQSRSEQLLVLEEELQRHGYHGLQLCVDELSLFLGSKDHRSLQSEASWLQFLGQRAARKSTFSLWCCFALQKEWQDVGDLEPYSLSQVRDRFQTLTLSMAHLPSLVKHRLVHRNDPLAIQQRCQQTYNKLTGVLPQIDFGITEWEELFPFHPATIDLLEQISSRFFSRTRSAVLFCTNSLQRYLREATDTDRITASDIFDYFQPEFSQFAELRELDRVWQVWQETIPRLAHDQKESALYTLFLKTLLLFRLSGQDVSCIQLANTCYNNLHLEAQNSYEYVHQLLVRWCKEGDHLSMERGADWQGDRFSVTLGQSIQQSIRRHSRRVLETLQSRDARIVAHLFETCTDATFPLSALLSNAAQIDIDWQNSSRQVEVALWQQNTSNHLPHQLLHWRQHGDTDVYLFLQVPFTEAKFPSLSEIPERNKAALLLWQARKPTSDEWEFARETTARFILHHDPALRDNRRGRAMIRFLDRDLKERTREVQQLVIRLYCEGRLTSGDKRYIEIAELCHQRVWDVLIPAISSFALETLYPQFRPVAPAVKVLSSSHINQLGNKLLQQNSADRWWPASLDRPVRAIAVPLGLAAEDKGRWKYAAGKDELAAEIERLLGRDALPVAAVTSHLATSTWGLLSPQIDLLLCGMLGAGQLESLDAQGNLLSTPHIKMPLMRSIDAVRRAALIGEQEWKGVCEILKVLSQQPPSQRSYAGQIHATQLLRNWRESTIAELELTNARLRQLQNAIDPAPALWKNTARTIESINTILQRLQAPDSSHLMETAATLDAESIERTLQSWRTLHDALDRHQNFILQVWARLSDDSLRHQDLNTTRQSLVQQFREGEKVLFNSPLLQAAKAWDEQFQQHYRDWHQQQFSSASWGQLRQFAHQPALQALQKLASVKRYPFPDHIHIFSNLQNSLRHQCPRDGSLVAGDVYCNHCQLHLGHNIELPDLTAFSARIATAMQQVFTLFQSAEIKRHLQRSADGDSLLHWNGDAELLLPLLNQSALTVLQNALLPRRQFSRSLRSLNHQLGQGGTRTELEKVFIAWLEADDAIGAEDEIVLE